MNGFKWLVGQFLQLPRWERNGNFILIGIIFTLTLLVWLWPQNDIDEPQIKQLNTLTQNINDKKKISKSAYIAKNSSLTINNSAIIIKDIHKASFNDLISAGLDKHTASTLLKYISKGGKIKYSNDLNKIYGLTDEMKTSLLKHCMLKEDTSAKKKSVKNNFNLAINLNSADSIELTNVRGIGNKLAGRIVNYRKKLGGFYQLEQLKEIYGLREENYNIILNQVKIEGFTPSIKINTINAKELKKHPYFRNGNLAEAIIAFRDKHGKFHNIEDIKKCELVTTEIAIKIHPYLVFD